jgi:cobyrinic acid a,c-diamide synthase
MIANVPRILFGAAGSGSGKTTVTCAVIKALQNKGVEPAAFKCGPDFIDPMFHSKVLGAGSANLDLFLMGAQACKMLIAEKSGDAAIAVIEGVMGYYDGIGATDECSTYHLSKETGTPAVLIVECRGVSVTISAILNGIRNFRPDSNIKGVIFNRIKPSMYEFYKSIVESNTPLVVLGYMPDMPECRFESRHLGLVTADEIGDLRVKIDRLAEQAAETVDLDAIIKMATNALPLEYVPQSFEKQFEVKIAVARDNAFCFYYEDSLAVLKKLGAKILTFSPLAGELLPECDGFILGGGYPELYLEQISQNTDMLRSIHDAVADARPCLAECGGFMLLQKSIKDKNGVEYKSAGVIDGQAYMTERLTRFGYVRLTARRDNLLCAAGESIGGHEFHYSDSTTCGDSFVAQKPAGAKCYSCIEAGKTLFAGYPHIHFMGNVSFAVNFLTACQKYKNGS